MDVIAVACGVGLGMGLRAALQPLLGDTVPFVLAFAAVGLVSVARGPWAGAASAVLCALWTALPWLPPELHEGPTGGLQTVLFLISALFVAFCAGRNWKPWHVPYTPSLFAQKRVGYYRLPIAAVSIPIFFFVVVATIGYFEATEAGFARLERTARIATEHVQRVIETNEVIARTMAARLGDAADEQVMAAEGEHHRLLLSLERDLYQIQSIWVLGANGRALVSSRFLPAPRNIEFADRAYFRALRDTPVNWYVTEVLTSRSTGEPFFDIARSRKLSGGEFAGVINVSLRPEYFSHFYRSLAKDEPGLVVTLLREDGAIIARWPEQKDRSRLMEQSAVTPYLRAGATQSRVRGASTIDGRERFRALSKAGSYPLYVVASLGRDPVLRGWYSNIGVLAGIAFPAAIMLGWLVLVAQRRRELERLAQAKLLRESEFRMQAEEALRNSQKLEALGRLTGGVAHDFNNLLMVVGNNVFLEQRFQPQGQDNPRLAAMRRAVETGTKLTRQLLAFAGRQPTAPVPLQLQEFLPALREMLRTLVGGSIELTIDVDPATPAIMVDPAEIELAIINLAINAKDALSGAGRLALDAYGVDGKDAGLDLERYVAIRVTDNGPGIPPEIADKVFDPFFTTKPTGKGTGLGLSQVYGFCTQSSGTVRLSPALGGGTVVTLYLPALDESQVVDVPDKDEAKVPAVSARVLLVEDNTHVAVSTSELLRGLGCEVDVAASADEAGSLLTKDPSRWDVVLSDIVMPGTMNGVALAQLVRQRWPSLPILLMTGYAPEYETAVLDNIEILRKPLQPEALARTLARYVSLNR